MAIAGVPGRMLELSMRMKRIPDVLIRSVLSLYEGAKTRVTANSE